MKPHLPDRPPPPAPRAAPAGDGALSPAVLDALAARARRQALTIVLVPADPALPAATLPLLAGLLPRLGRRCGDVRWPPDGSGLPPWRQGRARGVDDSAEMVAWFNDWRACQTARALDWCPPLPDDRLLLLVAQAGDGLALDGAPARAPGPGAGQADAWLRGLAHQQRRRAALLRWPVHLMLLLAEPATATLQCLQAAGLALEGAVVQPRPGLPAP